MEYKFALEQRSYEDFASGAVLYNQAGATSFPVRLGSEIFQRCSHHLAAKGIEWSIPIYDPLLWRGIPAYYPRISAPGGHRNAAGIGY